MCREARQRACRRACDVGCFSLCIRCMSSHGSKGADTVEAPLLPYDRPLLPYNRSILPHNRPLLPCGHCRGRARVARHV